MKCLNRIEMQEYIDNEVTRTKVTGIINHLETCEKCMNLYKQSLDEKEIVDRLLKAAETLFPEKPVPEFIPPSGLNAKKKYIPFIIEMLVAASLIGFVLFFNAQKIVLPEKINESEILLYEYYDGADLNKMWHEKSQIIILQDEQGNVIQQIITN